MEGYLAEVRMFAGPYAPMNWKLCAGQILNIADYEALFSLLGTAFGGDGSSTFGLPNLQCRAPIGVTSSHYRGQKGGWEAAHLIPDNLPAHTHSVEAFSDPPNQPTPVGTVFAPNAQGVPSFSSSDANAAMSASMVAAAGASAGVPTQPPYQVVNFIICVNGIYPSRN